MYESYADVLESYMIAEEGFGDIVKKVGSKALEILKGLKDKIIAFFKRIVESIKSRRNEKGEKKDPPSPSGQYAIFNLCLRDLQQCLGYLSKAIGASKTVKNSDDDAVQSQLDYFKESIDRVSSRIDAQSEWYVLDAKIIDSLVSRAESIKNTFVQEVDLAIKIVSAANYNMANNATHLSSKLADQLCHANSRFLSVYTNLLRHLEFCSNRGSKLK